MTTRKEALQELLEKVEADVVPEWDDVDDVARNQWANVVKAFHGSLDAAKELHEAVLPGWGAKPTAGGAGAGVAYWGCVIEEWDSGEEISVHNMKCPARAWLIAILKALIAQDPEA